MIRYNMIICYTLLKICSKHISYIKLKKNDFIINDWPLHHYTLLYIVVLYLPIVS